VKREATIAGLASEGLALISGSAGAGISAVMGPTPADPVEMNCRQESQILAPKKTFMRSDKDSVCSFGISGPAATLFLA